MSGSVHMPAVAGLFYPEHGAALARAVDDYLVGTDRADVAPLALIVPHAGYVYSGAVAGRAFSELKPWRDVIRRVVLLGPSHRAAFRGMALPAAQSVRTPLGDLNVDSTGRDKLIASGRVQIIDEAHAQEHSVEVQLPFLQRVLGTFTILPIVVGDATAQEVAGMLDHLTLDTSDLVVISTDLSHFHTYDEAVRIDGETAASIVQLSTELRPEQACGCRPVNGFNVYARARGLEVQEVSRCNSGDTAGSTDRVVGYGAYTVRPRVELSSGEDDNNEQFSPPEQERLLSIARQSVEHGLRSGRPLPVTLTEMPMTLREDGASFVTLHLDGELRGCIGSLTATRPLAHDVAEHAFAAAFNDPRFPPVTTVEAERLTYHIAVLGPSQPLVFNGEADLLSRLRPGIDGLTIWRGVARATFLPAVWEGLPQPQEFLLQLKRKAGIAEDAEDFDAAVYQTQSFPI